MKGGKIRRDVKGGQKKRKGRGIERAGEGREYLGVTFVSLLKITGG